MEQIKQILKNKKIYLRDFIAIIVIFFLSLFVEQVLLQWNSFKNEKYEQTFQVSEVQKAENKDGETTYDFLFDGRYVSSIYLIYQSKTDISSRMEVTFYDGYGQKEVMELEDTASFLLGKSAVWVDQKVDSLKLTVENKDADKLNSIIFVNHTVFSWAKFLLVFSVLLLSYLFVSHCTFFGKRPEWMYAMVSVALGTVIILSAHHSFDSWDEQIHYNIAYTDSWVWNYMEYSDAVMSNVEMRVPTGDTLEEEQWIGEWLNQANDTVVLSSQKGRFLRYGQRAYLPQILGLGLGRTLGLSYVATVFLGKFFNLLFCTAVVTCAIRFSKYGKRTLMCVGLLPTTVFLFSSFTYDAFVIALLMLGIALFVTEYLGEEKIQTKRTMVSILAMVVGCFSKAVYIPFLALYWLMPKDKFYSRRQKNLFKAGIFVLLILMFASFILPLIGNVTSGAEVGDYRGGDTSQTSQLSMILGYPLTYTGVLLKSLGTTFASYFIGSKVLANFAYRGIYDGIGYFVVLLTMLFTFVTDFGMTEKTYDADKLKKGGYTSTQTVKKEDLNWRVLRKNDDGSIDLIGDATSNSVYFSGSLGYNNGVYLLNDICKELYSNSTHHITARSVNLEDMEKWLTDSGKTARASYSTAVKYGETKEYKGSNSYTPDIYGKTEDESANYYSEPTTNTYTPASGTATADNTLNAKQTYYNIPINQTNYGDGAKVLSSSNYYWVAARCVNCYSSNAYFGLRYAGSVMSGTSMFYSYSKSYSGYYRLRPVVSLGSDVQITPSTGTNSASNKHTIDW